MWEKDIVGFEHLPPQRSQKRIREAWSWNYCKKKNGHNCLDYQDQMSNLEKVNQKRFPGEHSGFDILLYLHYALEDGIKCSLIKNVADYIKLGEISYSAQQGWTTYSLQAGSGCEEVPPMHELGNMELHQAVHPLCSTCFHCEPVLLLLENRSN